MQKFKNVKFWLTGLVMLFILSNCDLVNSSDESDNTVSLGSVRTKYQDINYLGRGYDVFSDYANPTKVKDAILDIDKLNDEKMLQKDDNINEGEFKTVYGTSLSQYQDKITAKVKIEGDYKLFKSEVETNFSSISAKSTYLQYATIRNTIQKISYFIEHRRMAEELKPYLDSTFEGYLNNPGYSPKDLFNNFGTHCLTGIIIGARFNYNLEMRKKEASSSSDISAYAKSSFKGLFSSASIEADVNKKWSDYFYTSETNITTRVYGGKPEYGQSIKQNGNYEAWINSVDDNPVFMDFLDDGLLPIWELCDSQERANEIKSAFQTYAADHQIQISKPTTKFDFQVPKVMCTNSTDPNGGDGGVRVTFKDNNGTIYFNKHTDWGQDKMKTGTVREYPNWNTITDPISNDQEITIECKTDEVDNDGRHYVSKKVYIKFDESKLMWKYNRTGNAEYKYLSNNENEIQIVTFHAGGDTDMRYYLKIKPMPTY